MREALSNDLGFLELGERLRQRGQLAAAATVCLNGLTRAPTVAAAHDLLGRIRADQGDDAAAITAWRAALECDPEHVGARKGLAFVAFRAHDLSAAERQLESAAALAPHDASVLAALDRIRALRVSTPEPAPALGAPGSDMLLFDLHGLRLAGGIDLAADADRADLVSAESAGLMKEALRASRLLELGALQYLVIEAPDARTALAMIEDDAALLVRRSGATPLGRLLALVARAVPAARTMLAQSS